MATKGRPQGAPQAASSQQAPGGRRPRAAGSPVPTSRRKGDAQVTTPARPIDTKQLTETVKEEVKGGEASEGPTPVRLSLAALQARADQGRAAGRQGSRRAAAAHSQDLRSGVESDHQRQVRAGPPALLRSAGLARRHGELRDLP